MQLDAFFIFYFSLSFSFRFLSYFFPLESVLILFIHICNYILIIIIQLYNYVIQVLFFRFFLFFKFDL